MRGLTRRQFLAASAAVAAPPPSRTRVGLVHSAHKRLPRPVPVDHPLDYDLVRDMVWKAIEYGRPRAGSLAAKIRPGSWVVIKPNIVFLRPQGGYRSGDITDFRVTKAVLEYVARNSRAARVTVAEGGTYRSVRDPEESLVVRQNGVRVDASSFDWGTDEFPGFGGSLGGMLAGFSERFPGKKFDYIDLSYDAVRDASGAFRRVEVPRSPNGTGAFGARPDYYVTNTILNCDFLINVPVMKIHRQCGITVCMKNYVGTAPRQAYAAPDTFHNVNLHSQHEVEDRIDGFIADLTAFHPADYSVVDAIRGLQHAEHNNRRPDQMIRGNMVFAGEDIVATDALASLLMGFNPWDMDFLHMGVQREMGAMDFGRIEIVGDEPDRLRQRWGKPRDWYGRCNREWLVASEPDRDLAGWARYTTPVDTLHFARWTGSAMPTGKTLGAAVRVRAEGHRKAVLWMGAVGAVSASLNGETVLQQESRSRHRIGQFRQPVELRPGENLLQFRLTALTEEPQLSALLAGSRNDGDTVEGIRYSA